MRNLFFLLLLSLYLFSCKKEDDLEEISLGMHDHHGSITVQWDSIGESIPTSMFKAFCVETENYVFVGGGRTSMDSTFSSESWVLDRSNDQWSQVADIPFDETHSRSAFAIEDDLYVLVNKQLVLYDLSSNSWTDRAFYPGNGTHEVTAIGYYGFGYAGCGARLNPNHSERDFFQYDPEKDEWIRKNDFLGFHRRACSSFAYDGKIYFALGRCHNVTRSLSFEDPMSNPQYLRDIFAYDISTNEWTKVSLFPDDEIKSADLIPCLQKENLVYFLGGFNGSHHQNLWEYDIITGDYQKCNGTTHYTSHLANTYSNDGMNYVLNGITADSSAFKTGIWTFSVK